MIVFFDTKTKWKVRAKLENGRMKLENGRVLVGKVVNGSSQFMQMLADW